VGREGSLKPPSNELIKHRRLQETLQEIVAFLRVAGEKGRRIEGCRLALDMRLVVFQNRNKEPQKTRTDLRDGKARAFIGGGSRGVGDELLWD